MPLLHMENYVIITDVIAFISPECNQHGDNCIIRDFNLNFVIGGHVTNTIDNCIKRDFNLFQCNWGPCNRNLFIYNWEMCNQPFVQLHFEGRVQSVIFYVNTLLFYSQIIYCVQSVIFYVNTLCVVSHFLCKHVIVLQLDHLWCVVIFYVNTILFHNQIYCVQSFCM